MTCKMGSVTAWCFCILIGGASLAFAQKDEPKAEPPKAEAPKPNFDKTGPQVGEQVPDLSLRTLKGEEQRLSDAWRGGPALLVTSSLTCPKSRSRWPELKELVEKYDNKVNVVIVYVIEAHPVGSICPYKDVEDITPENQRDGILRKQPKTLDDRLELAQEFKRLLRISAPIYVDNIQDEAWKGLGGAPNLALLVDREGKVAARSGWFEGKVTQEAIDKYLAEQKPEVKREERDKKIDEMSKIEKNVEAQLEAAGFEKYSLNWTLRDEKKAAELEKMLKAVPQLANLAFLSDRFHRGEATALMEAVKHKNTPGAKLLLTHGADPQASTEDYASALPLAAETGNVEITKLLLEKGVNPNLPATGKSPLHQAALHSHTEFVKLLLDSGVKHDLYSAIALGEIELVRQGLKIDPSRALRPDGASRMPLDYAAANGQIEIAKLLVAHGATLVRTREHHGHPPLHRAIERNDAAMVEFLLTAGSSPDATSGGTDERYGGDPALHHAIEKKNLAIVKILLAHKADLNARDILSRTALHIAAIHGQTEIAATLLKAGADVNVFQLGYMLPCGSHDDSRPSNTTPLHFASGYGNPETVKLLLDAGAKINAVTKNGETPLMFAVKHRRYENDEGESNIKTVELLLAKGADLTMQDQMRESVLDIAEQAHHGKDERSQKDHEEMLALLKKHGAKPGKPKNPEPQPQFPVPAEPAVEDPFGGK